MNWLFAGVEWGELKMDYKTWWFDEFGRNDWVYGGIRWAWYPRYMNFAPPGTTVRVLMVS